MSGWWQEAVRVNYSDSYNELLLNRVSSSVNLKLALDTLNETKKLFLALENVHDVTAPWDDPLNKSYDIVLYNTIGEYHRYDVRFSGEEVDALLEKKENLDAALAIAKKIWDTYKDKDLDWIDLLEKYTKADIDATLDLEGYRRQQVLKQHKDDLLVSGPVTWR